MNHWQSYYQTHQKTVAEAVRLVKSGDLIVFSHACGEPRLLPAELMKCAGEIKDVKIVHMVPMGEALYCQEPYAGSFRHLAIFAGGPTRKAIWENRADYIPCFFNKVPTLFGNQLQVNVAMVTPLCWMVTTPVPGSPWPPKATISRPCLADQSLPAVVRSNAGGM